MRIAFRLFSSRNTTNSNEFERINDAARRFKKLEILAVLGVLVMLALAFRISGIKSVEWHGFRIDTAEKPLSKINRTFGHD